MNTSIGLRFLRPYLFKDLPVTPNSTYIRFFNTTRHLAASPADKAKKTKRKLIKAALTKKDGQVKKRNVIQELVGRTPVEQRVSELEQAQALVYPRMQSDPAALSCAEYQRRHNTMVPGEKRLEESARLYGRVTACRVQGKGLLFIDISQDGHKVQVNCNFHGMSAFGSLRNEQFQSFSRLVRRGDIITVYGHPYYPPRGELSINALELPTILSPSLANLPNKIDDPETRIRNRHVDLLVNGRVADTIRARSHITQYLRNFLLKDNFLEVQTPIIADSAGGAIARPFTTVATEFSDKQLALRIAPEIWLKRLILGGIDRVFEIGPAFRNEGLDATHNPEFTTCEFYKSFADLEDLISMTEKLLSGLAEHVTSLRKYPLDALPELDLGLFQTPFKRIEFIPAIEQNLGEKLPDLSADDAVDQLLSLFAKHNIPRTSSLTLPRLLDKLASHYIEPLCIAPTFIMHHPACMAPLSKSFLDPKTHQLVSARVELFAQNREIANMYEEENSPFEQRKKFVEQRRYRDDENSGVVDESYLEALEYGLPPTGGWGCGVDRLAMLFSGATRIADVLAFGSLKNVVGLGTKEVGEKVVVEKQAGVKGGKDIDVEIEVGNGSRV